MRTVPCWDEYFIKMAQLVATKSKDGSTKVGAVVVGPNHEVRSTGYNGFPRNVLENIASRNERPTKYLFSCHAEENAIVQAARIGVSCDGCTLYVATLGNNLPPCATCSRLVIQSGIVRVVFVDGPIPERWKESMNAGTEMFREASVDVVKYVLQSNVDCKTGF